MNKSIGLFLFLKKHIQVQVPGEMLLFILRLKVGPHFHTSYDKKSPGHFCITKSKGFDPPLLHGLSAVTDAAELWQGDTQLKSSFLLILLIFLLFPKERFPRFCHELFLLSLHFLSLLPSSNLLIPTVILRGQSSGNRPLLPLLVLQTLHTQGLSELVNSYGRCSSFSISDVEAGKFHDSPIISKTTSHPRPRQARDRAKVSSCWLQGKLLVLHSTS